MTCSTLMVHLEPGRSNAGLLQGDGVKAAAAELRVALSSKIEHLLWRSRTTAFAPVLEFLALEARAAELVLTGIAQGDAFGSTRAVDTGGLVLQVGRHVIIFPPQGRESRLHQVLIGWKDTRESKRAIVDALRLLRQAARVTRVTIANQEDLAISRARFADVARWLARHGVTAEQLASQTAGEVAEALWAVVRDLGADLIVAGAYGHGRLRKWVLGGVTKNLLLSKNRYSPVSH